VSPNPAGTAIDNVSRSPSVTVNHGDALRVLPPVQALMGLDGRNAACPR
jgi:hypothetical protein